MDEEIKKILLDAIIHSIREKVRTPQEPPMKMEVKTDIKDAENLGQVLVNHKVSLASKEFIVIGDSADDPTQCVSVIQVEKHTLRNIINKLIRAYKQIEEREHGNV